MLKPSVTRRRSNFFHLFAIFWQISNLSFCKFQIYLIRRSHVQLSKNEKLDDHQHLHTQIFLKCLPITFYNIKSMLMFWNDSSFHLVLESILRRKVGSKLSKSHAPPVILEKSHEETHSQSPTISDISLTIFCEEKRNFAFPQQPIQHDLLCHWNLLISPISIILWCQLEKKVDANCNFCRSSLAISVPKQQEYCRWEKG